MNLILDTFIASNVETFIPNLKNLLLQKIDNFTIFEVTGGAFCKPVAESKGINEGVFDIYDFAHNGDVYSEEELTLKYFDHEFIIKSTVFCLKKSTVCFIIALHNKIDDDSLAWLLNISPYIALRGSEFTAEETKIDLFIDYQKKIDFMKSSSEIFKSLTIEEVVANAIHFFTKTFVPDACCGVVGNYFAGMGLEQSEFDDIYINNIKIKDYTPEHNIVFIDDEIKSDKFVIFNILIVREPQSKALFVLFNIGADEVPDREFAELLIKIVSIAVENAKNHVAETKYKVEEAEMHQTVEILKQFVMQEIEMSMHEKIFSVNYPAKSTGGDFVTALDFGRYIFICVADVCGKGYSAAVFTVMLSTIMESGLADNLDLERLVNGVNDYMLKRNFNERFITAFFCIYDRENKELNYVSCGHEPAMHFSGKKCKRLTSQNLPLGILEDRYCQQKVKINSGDLLFVYTDGVIEYINHDVLEAEICAKESDTPKNIVTSLYNKLITDTANQKDDFTCIAIKF